MRVKLGLLGSAVPECGVGRLTVVVDFYVGEEVAAGGLAGLA